MIPVGRLVWDEANVMHIARHEVLPDEVEQVCHGPHIVREAYGARLMLIGPTGARRMLTLVLQPQDGGGVYRTVTARPASRRERRLYISESGGCT